MRRHQHDRPRPRPALAAVLAALLGSPAAAQDTPVEALAKTWYYTEVVVFQRPAVLEHLGDEDLVREPLRGLPAALRPFGATGRTDPLTLDPATRLCLSYPYLDQARLAAPPADADFDPWQELGGAAAATMDAPPGGEPPPLIAPQLGHDPLLDHLAAVADFQHSLEAQSYQWLDADSLTLRSEAGRLARVGGYQVLLHGRWLQPVPPREAPEPLLVQAGPRFGEQFALEGSFAVTLGRYLHFNAVLFYREPLLGRAPLDQALPPPGQDSVRPVLPDIDAVSGELMQLRESRRLRSGELHYLDHPKLGVLVRMEPVTVPDALSAAGEALKEGAE